MTQRGGGNLVEPQEATMHGSSTTLLPSNPFKVDEREILTIIEGELPEPPDPPTRVPRQVITIDRESYRWKLRTFKVQNLQKRAEEMWKEQKGRTNRWKDEINYLFPIAGLFAMMLIGLNATYYVVRQTQTSISVTDALWFISLALTLATASTGY